MGSKGRKGPTLGVCLIEVSVKMGLTVLSILSNFLRLTPLVPVQVFFFE